MSDFLSLFTIFASSGVCYALLEILVPILVLTSAMSLIGVILHGKFV